MANQIVKSDDCPVAVREKEHPPMIGPVDQQYLLGYYSVGAHDTGDFNSFTFPNLSLARFSRILTGSPALRCFLSPLPYRSHAMFLLFLFFLSPLRPLFNSARLFRPSTGEPCTLCTIWAVMVQT